MNCEKNGKANSSWMYKITLILRSETKFLRNFSLTTPGPIVHKDLKQ